MSGSYDKPRGPLGPRPAPHFEPFDDVLTGPPSSPPASGMRPDFAADYTQQPISPTGQQAGQTAARPRLEAPVRDHPAPQPEIYAPVRDAKTEREKGHAPIVPAGSVTGRSLTLVISIMCFLACLTAGAVYMINQSANAWLKDIASEITIQVEPRENVDTEKTLKEVLAFLGKQPGVANAKSLSVETSQALLEPWLGQSDALKSLPVPRLVAIEVDRSAPPKLDELRAALTKQFKGVGLDDHRQWQQQIRTVTRSFALGGLAILLLVAAATTAIIISATRSAMASNREIVEVLHFVGATDRFIAREFEKHFLQLGIRAGVVGAGSAMLVFLVMPTIMELLGGGSVTTAELNRLIGAGGLDPAGYVLLGMVVVVVAALCMLTSRLGVFRILNSRN
ncbi:MAG: ABC transporter permease [Hyphomicrobium sp.]|nr:ABC transporter permease [Hyphomicrobium sp.]PPC81519.1 MAG: cell division protein [Hyphomicrobium sp.]